LLPTSWACFDIRVIAFGVVAVIPVTGWILLGSGRGLLDVDWRGGRYGDHGRRIIIRVIKRIAVIRIRVKRCAEIKAKTGMAVVASITRPTDPAIQAANHQ